MSLRVTLADLLRQKRQVSPTEAERFRWSLTCEESRVLWDYLVKQHHALVELTEFSDPDVEFAETVAKEGREAGLPEPWERDESKAQPQGRT